MQINEVEGAVKEGQTKEKIFLNFNNVDNSHILQEGMWLNLELMIFHVPYFQTSLFDPKSKLALALQGNYFQHTLAEQLGSAFVLNFTGFNFENRDETFAQTTKQIVLLEHSDWDAILFQGYFVVVFEIVFNIVNK